MKKYMKNLLYILKHKHYVFIECCKLGIPIRGITHDLSKLSKAEFGPYSRSSLFNDNVMVDDIEFDDAWEHHKKYNKHHWQHWVKDGIPTTIPDKYVREMAADFIAMGKNKNSASAIMYYTKHKDEMILDPMTRNVFENYIGYKKGWFKI